MSSHLSVSDPRERVIRCVTLLQNKSPFFAYILMNFDFIKAEGELEKQVETMAVDISGKLYWNPGFVMALSEPELVYVLCHEVMHIAKNDFMRQGSRDPRVWNIASDLAINDILNQENFTAPKKPEFNKLIPDSNGLIDLGTKKPINVRGRPTEDLYNEIMNYMDKVTLKLKLPGDGGQGNSQDGQGDGKNNPQDHGGFDRHFRNGNKNDGGNNSNNKTTTMSASEMQAHADRWKQTVVTAAVAAKQRGNLPGFAECLVEGLLNPKLDWKTRLRNYITPELPHDYDTRRPNRAFYTTGAWTPILKRETIEVFISIDCSGSTSGDREEFVSECMSILLCHPQVKARIICWDTRIDERNDRELSTDSVEQLAEMRIQDVNGGTMFSSYADYLNEKGYKPRVHIVLTDGYIENDPRVPEGRILFVLSKNGTDEIIGKYGEVIPLKDT